MPTGYTAAIADGISFNDFVMRCARAMGVCILMRDDPLDKPIPERFEPSDYHSNKINEIIAELEQTKAMSDEAANDWAEVEYNREKQELQRIIKKRKELLKNYKAMFERVRSWNPPTPGHQGLKDFMIKQINETIEWDCDTSWYEENQPQLMTGAQWKEEKIKKLERDLAYHTKENQEEISRTESRNKWIKELRDSLRKEAMK